VPSNVETGSLRTPDTVMCLRDGVDYHGLAGLFARRGGHLRLIHVSAAVNRLLDLFRCRESLMDPDHMEGDSP
jgi:hypothetical protein